MAYELKAVKFTEADLETLAAMLESVKAGNAVVWGGTSIHPGLPQNMDVGHRPGSRLRTAGPVDHVWMGFFSAPMGPGLDPLTFNGGGAITRSDSFTWTPIGGPAKAAGYNFDEAIETLESLIKDGYFVTKSYAKAS